MSSSHDAAQSRAGRGLPALQPTSSTHDALSPASPPRGPLAHVQCPRSTAAQPVTREAPLSMLRNPLSPSSAPTMHSAPPVTWEALQPMSRTNDALQHHRAPGRALTILGKASGAPPQADPAPPLQATTLSQKMVLSPSGDDIVRGDGIIPFRSYYEARARRRYSAFWKGPSKQSKSKQTEQWGILQ